MDSKKVKHALTIVFAALFTAILIVFPSFSAIIQSHCRCHTYANVYHKHAPLELENLTTTPFSNINITDLLL